MNMSMIEILGTAIEKSELFVSKAGNKMLNTVSPVKFGGIVSSKVTYLKYLGHWFNVNVTDVPGHRNGRRAWSVRINLIVFFCLIN